MRPRSAAMAAGGVLQAPQIAHRLRLRGENGGLPDQPLPVRPQGLAVEHQYRAGDQGSGREHTRGGGRGARGVSQVARKIRYRKLDSRAHGTAVACVPPQRP